MVASKGPVARLMGDVRACLEVGTVPILWGSPGVGKTQSVLKLFRDMGLIPIVIIGSQCEPTDIAGFPCVMGSTASHDDTPSTRFIPRDFVRKINDHPHNRYGILWDELTCVPTATMSAMLTPLTSWTFGDTQVDPKRVAMVAAANPPDEAVNGQELPPAVRNRLSRFPWPADEAQRDAAAKEWADEFIGYWGAPRAVGFGNRIIDETTMVRARGLVSLFIRRKPDLWHAIPPEAQTDGMSAFPTARSWDRVSWHLGHCLTAGLPPQEGLNRYAAEVGDAAAGEFATHLREAALPDPEEVLADAKNYKATGRIDVDLTVCRSVAAAVLARATPERVIAGFTIANRVATTKGSKGVPAYEAGYAMVSAFTAILKPGTPANKEVRSAFPNGVSKQYGPMNTWINEVAQLGEPYKALMAELGVVSAPCSSS
jgi:hypothetical protein